MSRNIIPAVIATAYLILYILLLSNPITVRYGYIMFLFSPVIVIGMVYYVLKFGKYDGPELGNDEFGYQDKRKDQLKTF